MCDGVELIGVAVSPVAGLVFAAINVGAEVPLHIPCNDEVEPAIAVVIYEGRACAPTAAADARLGSLIGESPVAIIVIQPVPETRIGFVWRNAAWHRIQYLCSIREE